MDKVHEQIGTLEQRFQRFRITGSPDVIIEGDIYHGYAVNVPQCGAEAAGVTGACCFPGGGCSVETEMQCITDGGTYQGDGTGCFPNPCPTVSGACCFEDGTCAIESESQCATDGGTYLGDSTTCTPNPCPQPPTGACCVGTDCTIETPDDCDGMGGTYQGDDTTCDPNPCELQPCDFDCGGFLNPDDGLYYNRKIYTNTPVYDCPPAGPCCISFGSGESCCDGWVGARWYFLDFCPTSRLTEQTYDSDCNLVETFEEVAVQVFFDGRCRGENGTAVPDCNGICPCLETDCTSQACPPEDPCVPGWLSCTSIDTVITYEDPCTP